MIIDCVTAFQELDILLLRMAELDPVVDLFVVVEADRTHAGAPKALTIRDNIDRLAPYLHKLHLHTARLPAGEGLVWTWRREIAQRNAIADALAAVGAQPDDMVLISDADEIPRRSFVGLLPQLPADGIAVAVQRLSYYTFNHTSPHGWNGTRATQYANVQALGADGVRYAGQERGGYPRIYPVGNAGWHLSYFGGPEAVSRKMRSFLHQELVTEENSEPDAIAERIDGAQDVYGRAGNDFALDWATDLPDAVCERPAAWAHHFHPDYAPRFHEDWMSDEQSTALSWLARGVPRDGIAVEIGAWEGRSSIAIAHGLGGRRLDVVDTWQGNVEEAADHPSAIAAGERDVYAQFLRNVQAFDANVQDYRMDWRMYARTYGVVPIAFLHLDAAHDEASVAEQLATFLPRLVPGGVICGDDFFAPGVSGPVLAAIPDVQSNGKMWYWRKPA